MQLWTDNRLKSTRHRVANLTKKERNCLITFMNPIPPTEVGGYNTKQWSDFKAKTAYATG